MFAQSSNLSRWVLLIAAVLFTVGCDSGEPGGRAPAGDTGLLPDGSGDAGDGDTGQPPDSTDEDTGRDVPDLDSDDEPEGDVTRPDADTTDDSASDTRPTTDELLLDTLEPSTGSTLGGTRFVLSGAGFNDATLVYFGGILAEDLDLVDAYTIFGVTPPGVAGRVDVKVADGASQALLSAAFTYVAPLSVESVEPGRGPVEGGAPLTVRGSGFTPEAQVSVGGRLGISTRFVDTMRLDLVAPPGSPGPADVRVTTVSDSRALGSAFVYFVPTRLLDVVPGSGEPAGGYVLELTGEGLGSVDEVFVGGIEAEIVEATPGRVTIVAPGGAPGPVDVTVLGNDGGATLVDGFEYAGDAAAAGVLAVRPGRGSVLGGDRVTVVGHRVGPRDTVLFGSSRATLLARAGDTFVVSTPPGGAGAVDVSITGGGQAPLRLAAAFEYRDTVRVVSVEPAEGPVEGGGRVTLRGAGFVEGMSVRFGAIEATGVEVVSGSEATATVPPGSPGPTDVVVAAGDGTARLVGGYTYRQELALVGFSPARGSIAGGTYVIVRGAGFTPSTRVRFGDLEAPSVELLDPATLAVRSPAAAEAGAVLLTVVDGEVEVRSRGKYTYYDPMTEAGGWWGGDILGSVNVTVVSPAGPVEDAFVTLSVRASSVGLSGTTDARGQVTISGPDLSGIQTVFASAKKHSSVSVTRVNATNVMIVLQPICGCYTDFDCESDEVCVPAMSGKICQSSQACRSDDDCSNRPNFVCTANDGVTEGICIENCGGEPPQPPPLGTIQGWLRGLDKITVPGANQRLAARVFTTRAGQPNPDPGPGGTIAWDGSLAQPYEIRSRLGDVVVIGLCGIEDLSTGAFNPLYLAVYRPLNVRPDTTYEANLECDIRLDEGLTVKVVSPPFSPGGAEVNNVTASLDFGNEGTLDIWQEFSTATTITLTRMAPLEGALAGLYYNITAVAEPNGGGVPLSQSMVRNLVNLDRTLTMPTYVPPARGVTPGPGETLLGRHVEWSLDTDVDADFYYVYISSTDQMTTYWEVFLPGDQTSFDLPEWPAGARRGPFPTGALLLVVISVDAYTFSYDNFEFNDFAFGNWKSYSLNGWLIDNP
jgi:hypothetical protein